MRILLCACAFLVLAAFSLTSCGGGESDGKRRIGVIPKGTSHEFWKAVEAGARKADAELPELEIVWKGPSGEGATALQQQIVENFLADGLDGICLAPLDGVALKKQVEQALAADVPVVIFDSGLEAPVPAITSYVATNNREGGVLAAQRMAELLGGKGNVLVIPYMIGSESTLQRERGFLEEIAKHPEIRVVEKETHGGPSESSAIRVAESLLQEHGHGLAGIFAPNESNVSGIITVLRRDTRGLAKKVKLVGFDFSPNIVDGLRDGVLHATILQDPVDMGYRAVYAMNAALNGEAVSERIETGLEVGTPENMNEPRIAELLGIGK